MRKKAWLFLSCLILFSAAGVLLRALELRTALDTATMLMDMTPASILLLILSALALALMGLLARRLDTEALPRRYNLCFGGVGSLVVSALSLALAFLGALLCLRLRDSEWSMRLFLSLLALMGFLAGAAWLALGLDGWCKKKADSFLSAILPVIFCGLFLIVFYKKYAQLPALLYSLYPFLGLCAALGGLHLVAGFAVSRERVRPRTALFLCGAGAYLCTVSLVGVQENDYRLFFAALALQLAAYGVCLLLPHPPEPEPEEEKKEEDEGAAEAKPEIGAEDGEKSAEETPEE